MTSSPSSRALKCSLHRLVAASGVGQGAPFCCCTTGRTAGAKGFLRLRPKSWLTAWKAVLSLGLDGVCQARYIGRSICLTTMAQQLCKNPKSKAVKRICDLPFTQPGRIGIHFRMATPLPCMEDSTESLPAQSSLNRSTFAPKPRDLLLQGPGVRGEVGLKWATGLLREGGL